MPYMRLPAKGAGWGNNPHPPVQAPIATSASSSSSSVSTAEKESATPLVDKIGEMAERLREQMGTTNGRERDEVTVETNVDDITEEERLRQEKIPRNPKKRMWEEQDLSAQKGKEKAVEEGQGQRDEL